ncbi:hypothetical protein [Paraburkholderia youngii]|uniref:hypothetical protein n=1 Tax=Paraburkholderia youngii TaxID=2782701 RepID=UPI003D227248
MQAPVLKNREWRYLLRDVVNAHLWLRAVPLGVLQPALAPAASTAWWIAQSQPELLTRESLVIVQAGAGALEFLDDGRWFAFLPWLLGRPDLKTRVILVGEGLAASASPLRRGNASDARRHIAHLERSEAFPGTVAQWRAAQEQSTHVDAYTLVSPGFAEEHRTWFAADSIAAVLKQGIPVGVFGGSRFEALEDQEVVRRLGLPGERAEPALNPWRLVRENTEGSEGFAHSAWTLTCTGVPTPLGLETDEFCAFMDLYEHGRVDAKAYGGVRALESLGKRWPIPASGPRAADALIELPRNYAVSESTGDVGYLHPGGFTPLDAPRIVVPAERLGSRPANEDVIARVYWALDLHRNWIEPQLEKRAPASTSGSPGDAALRAAVSSIDPGAMSHRRVEGGDRGPTHPHWAILFRHIGWTLENYNPTPARFEPAFVTPATKHGKSLPVFCEAYGYVPGDTDDAEASDAMLQLSRSFPDGSIVLFNLMPYIEVAGNKYQFGGMLFWDRQWRPFALNRQMHSADDVIDQIEAGFSFESVDPQYADNRCQLAIQFNQMCRGISPDARPESVQLTRAPWVWVLPDSR